MCLPVVSQIDNDVKKLSKRKSEVYVESLNEGTVHVTKKRRMKIKPRKCKNIELKGNVKNKHDEVVVDNSNEMLDANAQLRQLHGSILAQGSFHQGDEGFGAQL